MADKKILAKFILWVFTPGPYMGTRTAVKYLAKRIKTTRNLVFEFDDPYVRLDLLKSIDRMEAQLKVLEPILKNTDGLN